MNLEVFNQKLIYNSAKQTMDRIQNGEDPKREIRNLVDLGALFARGKFQSDFFELAQNELKKIDSPYYDLVTNFIQRTNHHRILKFGMNLGYNSLTAGVKKIRNLSQKLNNYIPWYLVMQLSPKGKLNIREIEQLVKRGEQAGIYSYLLFLEEGFDQFSLLAEVMACHLDSAFALILWPSHLLESNLLNTLEEVFNVFIGIKMNGVDPAQFAAAQADLKAAKMLYTGVYQAKIVDMQKSSVLARQEHFPLFLQLDDYFSFIDRAQTSVQVINDFRQKGQLAAIPINLWADPLTIDQNVSSFSYSNFISAEGLFYQSNTMSGKQQIIDLTKKDDSFA